jgi:hypothetical protein
MVAGVLGASIASNTDNVREKVQDAKNHVTSNGQLNEKTNINAGKNDGTYGGPLPGGDGSDKPSMLNAGKQPDQTEGPELPGPGGGGPTASAGTGGMVSATSTGGRTTNTASGAASGSTSGTASAGSDAGNDSAVSSEDVTQVQQPGNLPDETKYQIGQVKDGEFDPVRRNATFTQSRIKQGTYDRLNTGTEKYQDEKLLLRSKDDGSLYDIDPMTHREQSYEQMSKDTSEDVLNS